MIRLHKVSKRYGDHYAVRDIELHVEAGQRTALIGPSGCGKSTLMRLVVGLIEPDSGQIHVADQLVNRQSAQAIRHRVGYMTQGGGLFPHLTVADNVQLVASYLKWAPERIEQRYAELSDLVHIPSDFNKRFPAELSGGQQQRVALMRSLFLDPDVLLLDEPMGALDPLIRAGLQEDLLEIFSRLNKTILLVTHDISEAGFLCEQLALMKDGVILQRGDLATLVRAPLDPFVTQFINAQRSPLESIGVEP